MRILIIEDDEILSDSLTRAMTKAGYATDHAGDGERALAMLLDGCHDLAILDLNLPRMDGLTAARRLRKTCPGVRVVMLTGSDIEADQNRAREVGARYLRKDELDALADELCATTERN